MNQKNSLKNKHNQLRLKLSFSFQTSFKYEYEARYFKVKEKKLVIHLRYAHNQ